MTDDSLSDEDKDLFREHMRSVKPLKEPTKKTSSKAPSIPKPIKKRTSTLTKPQKEYFLSDFINDTVQTETRLSYAHSSVATKQLKALRNGQIHWEAKLDLHGKHVDAARQSLCQFIETQTQNDKRCVLIVHGKGGQEGAPPVIKNLVNRWLPQIDDVVAFHSALPRDGGTGALYVLLKRSRPLR